MKAKKFRETRKLFAGRRGVQCIIFRDQGSTDPPGGSPLASERERSCRVLDSRPRGRGFEPHRRHFVVVLEQDTFILA